MQQSRVLQLVRHIQIHKDNAINWLLQRLTGWPTTPTENVWPCDTWHRFLAPTLIQGSHWILWTTAMVGKIYKYKVRLTRYGLGQLEGLAVSCNVDDMYYSQYTQLMYSIVSAPRWNHSRPTFPSLTDWPCTSTGQTWTSECCGWVDAVTLTTCSLVNCWDCDHCQYYSPSRCSS